jgi:hypothetical protein
MELIQQPCIIGRTRDNIPEVRSHPVLEKLGIEKIDDNIQVDEGNRQSIGQLKA